MSKHGRQRASRAFNEERQINDTSDFTETFRCLLYRINQTTENLQCGYVILHLYGKMPVRRITETSFSSRFSIPFFSFQLKNKHSATAALTQDTIAYKKGVNTQPATHIHTHTHTLGVPIYVHRQAVVRANLSTRRSHEEVFGTHASACGDTQQVLRSTTSTDFFHSLLLQCLFRSSVMCLCALMSPCLSSSPFPHHVSFVVVERIFIQDEVPPLPVLHLRGGSKACFKVSV